MEQAGRRIRFGIVAYLFIATSIANADWPMQGQNCRRTGYTSAEGPLVTPRLKWQRDLGDWTGLVYDNAGPVVGPDGTVYQVSDGGTYAINPDGSEKWAVSRAYGRGAAALSPGGARVYVPCYVDAASKHGIAALNTNDGGVLWTYPFLDGGRTQYCSLAVGADGVIYVATILPASLHAIRPDGTAKWVYTHPNSENIGIEGLPAVSPAGNVYFVLNTVGLVALDPNGNFKWSNDDNYAIELWPTPCVLSDETVIIAGAGTVMAFNPDGSIKWESEDFWAGLYGHRVGFPGVAVSHDESTIYAPVTPEGEVVALDAQTGSTKWVSGVPDDQLDSSPVLSANGVLYVAGWTGVYALREQDGALLWQYEFNSEARFWGPPSPALGADGTLYAVASGEPRATGEIPPRLYAFGKNDIPAVTTDMSSLRIPEGSTGIFRVRLAAQPPSDVMVTVSRISGDAGITVTGSSTLNFTPSNWYLYQPVTLSAATSGDSENRTATIRCSATGLSGADVTAVVWQGTGTEASPYHISTVADWQVLMPWYPSGTRGGGLLWGFLTAADM
jgi:outer membrane protein assembly factor BamB